jgi:hypothetical protein
MFSPAQNLQNQLVVFFHVVAALAWKSSIDVSQPTISAIWRGEYG